MKILILLLSCLMVAENALAVPAWSQDVGTITTLYATADGKVGVGLSGNFPHALADGQCPIAAGGFAGNVNAAAILQSTLVAAKFGNKTVTLTTAGCEGSWLKIIDVYVN